MTKRFPTNYAYNCSLPQEGKINALITADKVQIFPTFADSPLNFCFLSYYSLIMFEFSRLIQVYQKNPEYNISINSLYCAH